MPRGIKGFQKGHPRYGTEMSKEAKKKMSERMKGNKFNLGRKQTKEHKRKIGEAHIGKRHSEEWKRKTQKEKHWNWKGGILKLQRQEIIAGRKKPTQCELCGRDGRICFDHDHKTGKFRGWLCMKCNTILGLIDEDTQTLKLMIEYIKKQ